MKQKHYENKVYGMGHTRLKRILDLIGQNNGLRVLDVGCANGRLGKLVKDKKNYVAGIEISSTTANQAREVLDEVYSFDIEDSWPVELQRGSFDIVLLPEILEHIFDPVYVLNNVAKALRVSGDIIITTPNFMAWTNRLRFLIGDFKYKEQGMFDFGHIRWFTYRYLKEVLAKTGFEVTNECHIIFPGKLTRILKHWPSLFAFQFILKAKKS